MSIAEIIPGGDLETLENPVEAAKAAGLRYFTDQKPGIHRKRAGEAFSYIGPNGEPLHDEKTLERIASLAIPPAWTDVWICPIANGHLQATGRDDRGRKQYRYHPHWREVRDETKFFRMIAFAEALPTIRDRTDRDLSQHALTRSKVLATIVQLLDRTAIRVGNEEYAKENHSYGLTTMLSRHVRVRGSDAGFHFTGKSGKEHVVTIHDRRLARALERLHDLPGQELFQFVDHEGTRHSIDSGDVNEYLREISGEHFTAKDFRTWDGTVRAAEALASIGPFKTQTEGKHNVTQAIEQAAEHLGNTPAICRKSYVHPGIIESYLNETLVPVFGKAFEESKEAPHEALHPEEVATLAVLEAELIRERDAQAAS